MSDVQIAKPNANFDATVGEKISALATAILREETGLSKYFRDVTQFAVKGIDKIIFPMLGKFTVQNRTQGSTSDRQAPAVTTDSLDLDQNAYIKYGIDGSSEVQSTLEWKLECAKIAAGDHAESFESKLISTISSKAIAVDVTLTSETENGISDVKLLTAMRKKYRDAKAKIANGVWLINTALEERILSNPELFKVNGLGSVLIVDGLITKLYGIPVEVRVMTDEVLLCYGPALNYGFQKGPKYAEQPDINYGTDGVLCAMDQLYGVGASYVIDDSEDPNDGKSKVMFKKGTVTPFDPEA